MLVILLAAEVQTWIADLSSRQDDANLSNPSLQAEVLSLSAIKPKPGEIYNEQDCQSDQSLA